MTTKQYKKLCRIKVERYAKLITFLSVTLIAILANVFHINIYIAFAIVNGIWFYMPDIAAYALEELYKLAHNRGVYR